MSQESMTQTKGAATSKTARKRYTAPQLEVYGSVPALTQTSFNYTYFDNADISTYYVSAPS